MSSVPMGTTLIHFIHMIQDITLETIVKTYICSRFNNRTSQPNNSNSLTLDNISSTISNNKCFNSSSHNFTKIISIKNNFKTNSFSSSRSNPTSRSQLTISSIFYQCRNSIWEGHFCIFQITKHFNLLISKNSISKIYLINRFIIAGGTRINLKDKVCQIVLFQIMK